MVGSVEAWEVASVPTAPTEVVDLEVELAEGLEEVLEVVLVELGVPDWVG